MPNYHILPVEEDYSPRGYNQVIISNKVPGIIVYTNGTDSLFGIRSNQQGILKCYQNTSIRYVENPLSHRWGWYRSETDERYKSYDYMYWYVHFDSLQETLEFASEQFKIIKGVYDQNRRNI